MPGVRSRRASFNHARGQALRPQPAGHLLILLALKHDSARSRKLLDDFVLCDYDVGVIKEV